MQSMNKKKITVCATAGFTPFEKHYWLGFHFLTISTQNALCVAIVKKDDLNTCLRMHVHAVLP